MKNLVNMKKTDFVTVANAQVREYEAFLRHLDVIADVTKRMDGKKYTKRFRDAIDEACEVVTEGVCQGWPRFRIHFKVTPQRDCGERFDYSRLYASFHIQNSWVQLRTDRNDVATGTYIDNYMRLSFYMPKALADDRINAGNILEAIEETKKRVENDILILKDAVKRYDFYKRAVKRLEELIGEKAAKINPILRPDRFTTFMPYAQLSANFLENVKNSGK